MSPGTTRIRLFLLAIVAAITLCVSSNAFAGSSALSVTGAPHAIQLHNGELQVSVTLNITDAWPVDTCTFSADGAAPLTVTVLGTAQISFSANVADVRKSTENISVTCGAGSYSASAVVVRTGQL